VYVSLGRLVNRISIVLLFLVYAVVLEPVSHSLNYSALVKAENYCKENYCKENYYKPRRRVSNTTIFCIWKLPLDGRKEH
jgi:hypothetical protein